ncbi:hypothetical protein V2W30_41410 (plasmid) [Streptomyces sp. Q6]|uniref:Uncharacterized protein n=1 Tax=Streptomyces citrinus TaxID=3118173 RepID=A0ACD5AR04_9ACTN
MTTSPSLTIDTPTGPVHATAHRRGDAVLFELGGAMRGAVHVTGTHHPHHWDQFTAVRACLGPVNAFQTTVPNEDQPRLAHSRTGYHGSLTLHTPQTGLPQTSTSPITSVAGHPPTPKTEATLTAVLHACAAHVGQRDDLPALLQLSRERDTPALLRFLTWSVSHHRAEAARLEREARSSLPKLRSAVAAWWTVARWCIASPHPVLLLMLANLPDSLARNVRVNEWWGSYCLDRAAEEHDRARSVRSEVDSLRAQQQVRTPARRHRAAQPRCAAAAEDSPI